MHELHLICTFPLPETAGVVVVEELHFPPVLQEDRACWAVVMAVPWTQTVMDCLIWI